MTAEKINVNWLEILKGFSQFCVVVFEDKRQAKSMFTETFTDRVGKPNLLTIRDYAVTSQRHACTECYLALLVFAGCWDVTFHDIWFYK